MGFSSVEDSMMVSNTSGGSLFMIVVLFWVGCFPFRRSWSGYLLSSIFSSSFVTYLRDRDTEYRRSFNLLNFIRKNYVYIPLVLSAFYSFTNIVLFKKKMKYIEQLMIDLEYIDEKMMYISIKK